MAASGYRVTRERHHERSLDSLRLTVGVDEAVVRRLQAFRRKRNIPDDDSAGSASPSEAAEMRAIAVRLHAEVRDWVATTHPGLLTLDSPDAGNPEDA